VPSFISIRIILKAVVFELILKRKVGFQQRQKWTGMQEGNVDNAGKGHFLPAGPK
jgi:hypothetical protein